MRRTAVAAPAQPPFEDILETIDQMDGPTLRAFIAALRDRYALAEPGDESPTIRTSITWAPGTMAPDWWRQRDRWGTFS